MSLAARLSEMQANPKIIYCKVGKLIHGTLSQEEADQLQSLINAPEISATRISNADLARVLREEGYDISNSAMDRHRRNECACTRKTVG
jgi:type III secretory pathway lipoprotein EscJ